MNTEYILYLDMDGVLVDYSGGYNKLIRNGIHPDLIYKNTGFDFWAGLELIRGGKELWESSKTLFKNVKILSSAGKVDEETGKIVAAGKREWCRRNISDIDDADIIIVNGKQFKIPYANKFSILVDDMPITIQRWNSAGGYGILHNSRHFKNTIEELEDISRPITLSELIKRFRR